MIHAFTNDIPPLYYRYGDGKISMDVAVDTGMINQHINTATVIQLSYPDFDMSMFDSDFLNKNIKS